ncbi:HNH endonuclease (plasmid) [Deinococcus sp. QL22]|nr:HNH endonuclease [Deinococcus sp. QL22]
MSRKHWRDANLEAQLESLAGEESAGDNSQQDRKSKERNWKVRQNDLQVKQLLDLGRLTVQLDTGLVYAVQSKTPLKAIGALQPHGYLRACLSNKDQRVMVLVHRIVWSAAHSLPPLGQQINHRDGCKTSNALPNLELVSPAENNAHARETGLWEPQEGLANGFAKLSQQQFDEARALSQTGVKTAEIAQLLGVSKGYMGRILAGTARRNSP